MAGNGYNIQLPGSTQIHDQFYPNLRSTAPAVTTQADTYSGTTDRYANHAGGLNELVEPARTHPLRQQGDGLVRRAGNGEDIPVPRAASPIQNTRVIDPHRQERAEPAYQQRSYEDALQLSDGEAEEINQSIETIRAQRMPQTNVPTRARQTANPPVQAVEQPATNIPVPSGKPAEPLSKKPENSGSEVAPPTPVKPRRAPSNKTCKKKDGQIVEKKAASKKKSDYGWLIVPLIAAILFLFFFHPKTAKYVDKYLPPSDSNKGVLIRTGIIFFVALLAGLGCKIAA